MKSLLVHGCYDRATLRTLTSLGIHRFAFDLRGSSPNLIPFKDLNSLLPEIPGTEIVLTFQDDKASTVLSFLDLLKDKKFHITLEFRDQKDIGYYHMINHPFIWMFHPAADWKNILLLPNMKSILLPLAFKNEYQNLPHLWELIEQRNIEVFIHARDMEEASEIEGLTDVNVSVDLTAEIETSFRRVDQERLKTMQIWRKLNEHPLI